MHNQLVFSIRYQTLLRSCILWYIVLHRCVTHKTPPKRLRFSLQLASQKIIHTVFVVEQVLTMLWLVLYFYLNCIQVPILSSVLVLVIKVLIVSTEVLVLVLLTKCLLPRELFVESKQHVVCMFFNCFDLLSDCLQLSILSNTEVNAHYTNQQTCCTCKLT